MRILFSYCLVLISLCSACLDLEVDVANINNTSDDCALNEIKITVVNKTNQDWQIKADYFGCNLHLTTIEFTTNAHSTLEETITESINQHSSNMLFIKLLGSDGSEVSFVSQRVSQPAQLKVQIIQVGGTYKIEFI